MTTGRAILPPKDVPISIWSVAFSPDGKLLAAGMGDCRESAGSFGSVRLWDVADWRVVQNLRGHKYCVWSVAFNANGTRLASASGTRMARLAGEVILWDIATSQELWRVEDKGGALYGVAFSPDGRRLALGGQSGTVKILDGTPLAETPVYAPLPDNP
jgi:WD40 repeat protein